MSKMTHCFEGLFPGDVHSNENRMFDCVRFIIGLLINIGQTNNINLMSSTENLFDAVL